MAANSTERSLLTLREAAAQLGLADTRTLRRLLQHHELPVLRFGRSLRVHPDDLQAAVRASAVVPARSHDRRAPVSRPSSPPAKRPKARRGFKESLATNWWREHRVDCDAGARLDERDASCNCPRYWRESIAPGLRRTHGPRCQASETRVAPRICGCPFSADVADENGRKRIKAPNATQAKAELTRRRALDRPGRAASSIMTVAEFFDGHLLDDFGLAERTTWLYKRDFDLLHRDRLGHVPLDQVTTALLQQHANTLLAVCRARRQRTGRYVPDAISAMWTPVRSIFKHAIASGRLEGPNPTAGVRLPAVPKPTAGERPTRRGGNVVARQELMTLRAWLDGRGRGVDWGLALQIAFEHALRPGEVRGLRVGDVDLSRRLLRIYHQVTETAERKRPKHVEPHAAETLQPLSAGLVARLAEWLERHPGQGRDPEACLFWSRTIDQPLTHMAFHHALHRAQQATGVRAIDGYLLTPHGLRHSGLTYIAQRGASALDLQHHARHASIRMTDRYLHMTSVEALRPLADMHDQ